MSSDESEGRAQPPKRLRRLAGSCDFCRKRKIKCDSSTTPNARCTNCITNDIACTHDAVTKKRGVKNYTRQVSVLQARVQELEDALREARETRPLSKMKQVTPAETPTGPEEDESDLEYLDVLQELRKFSINGQSGLYFGPSSNIYFIRKMMATTDSNTRIPPNRKWTILPWEADDIKRPNFMFPEPDLLEDLLSIYFDNHPACLPLLHEPSFRKDVASGLHHVDTSFGACLLHVCAIASRLSMDPRVYVDGKTQASAGWKYFSQTTSITRSIFRAPTLYDVQFCCLSAEYILGTSAPQAGWAAIGLGMRLAVELGYHRHRPQKPTVQSECEKRVFWVLLFLDRHCSIYHGRPFCIRDEDFDVEMPIDCDDEFMDTGNPDMDFKQPLGRLSRLSAFLHHLRLSTIISYAMRTLYGIRKSKKAAGLTTNAMDDSVSIIDSMLNSWFNAIPPHLRWEPSLDPNPYFAESAMLYMSYYMLQMLIHRPFIHKTTPQSLPSSAICTNAARSLSRLLECWSQRKLVSSFVVNMSAFVAGIILIMNMRKRRATNPAYRGQDLEDLLRCLRVLQCVEARYSVCGRLIHTLKVLADLPCEDSSSSSPDSNGSGSGSSNNDMSSVHVMSGYVLSGRDVPPDFAELDPTLFGLAPPEERWSEVDLSLFDEEAMNVWAMPPGGGGGGDSWIDWNGYVNAMDVFQ